MDVNELRRKVIAGLNHSHLAGKAGGGVNVLARQRSAGLGGVTKLDVGGEPQCEDGSLGMAHKFEEEGNILQQNDELVAAAGCELGRSLQEDTELGYWQREYPMGVACLTGTTGMEVDKIASGIRDSGDTGYGVKSVAIENGATVTNRTNDAMGIDSKNADNVSNEGLIVVNESSVNDNNDKQCMRDSSKSAADCALTSDVLPDVDLVFTSASSGIGMSSLLDSDEKQALPLTNFSLHSQRTEVLSEVIDQVVADFSHETKQSYQDESIINVTNGAINGTTKGPTSFNGSSATFDPILSKNVVNPQCIYEDVRLDNGQMQSHYNEDAQLTINANQDSQQKTNSRTHYKGVGNITRNLNRNVHLAKPKKAKASSENMTQMNSQSKPQTQADKITTTHYQTNSQRMLTQQSPFDFNTIGANKMNHAKKLTNNSLDEVPGLGHQVNIDTNYWATHKNVAHKQQSPLNGITHSNTKQTLRTSQRELDAHGDNTMHKHMFKITSLMKTISRLPNSILSKQLKQSDQSMHGATSVATATINNMNDQLCDHSTHHNIESKTPIGENSMSILKTTTKYLTKRSGEILARTRDKLTVTLRGDKNSTAVTTPFVDAASGNSFSSVQQRNYVADSAQIFGGAIMQRMKQATRHLERIASGSMREVRQVNTGVNSQKTGIFASLMARAAGFFAAGGIISKGAIARAASIAVAAMVIFGAGSVVVLPVSEVQAQTINYISSVGGSVSQDLTEPTGNAGATEFSYTFSGVDTPRSDESSVPLTITVVETESTARLGADFTIPTGQTVDAFTPGADNKVTIMLNADTFKEGNEKIVLMVTLPPDGTSEVEFKQFLNAGATVGGNELKSIKITFNVTDEASDTEIDPIAPVLSTQDHILEYNKRNDTDGTTITVVAAEPSDVSDPVTKAYYSFREITSPISAGYTNVPVTVSVIEGPTDAILGTDFIIPPNQTLDFSTANATNRVEIQYKGDTINEERERILVWISLPENLPVYFQSTAPGSVPSKGVRVRFDIDDEASDSVTPTAPTRTVKLETDSSVGFFGGDIPFTVTIDPAPADGPVGVPLYVRDSANSTTGVSLPGTFVTVVPAGTAPGETRDVFFVTVGRSGTAQGVIRVAETGVTSPVALFMHSSIKEYTFDPSGRFISIPIEAAPPASPEISISGPSVPIVEGSANSDAVFTLTASNASRTKDVTIAVDVRDIAGRTGADYVDDGTFYTVLKANSETATLSVPTRDDNVEGVDGVVMATISSGTGYTIKSGANIAYADIHEASTTVTPLSVTVSRSGATVEEGTSGSFTISRGTGNTTGDLEVRYNLVESEDLIDGEGTSLSATIDDGQTSVNVPITIKTSSTDYPSDAKVILTILSARQFTGARYRLGTTASAEIGVTNSAAAPVPVVSVTGLGGTVTQGHSFSFTVEATGTLTNPLSVEIAIEDQNSGAIVTGATPSGVFIPDDSGSIMIPTSGSVEVVVTTANPGSISGNVTGNITLYPSSSGTVFQVEGGGTFVSYDVVFKDNTASTASQPRLSIAGPASSVRADQSASADFTITSTPAPTGTIDVYYNVSETGNFVTDGDDNMVLTFTGGTATLPITTSDSVGDDADSTLTVTLLDRSDYSIADNPGHIGTATITDDAPVPVVSVTGLGGTVTQGHSFSFTVEATGTLTNPLSVEIAIEDQNSGAIVTGATPSGVFIPDDSGSIMIPTSGSVEVVVTTANPGSISGNVTGNITLYPSSSGTVFQVEGGGTFVSYDVVFKDNTASTASQPRLSIAGPASSVRADQSASADFTITSTPAPTGTIDVYYNVSETGNFVTDGDDNMVLTFTGGTATLPITTSDSVGDDADSTLTVTLLDRSDYSIADNPGHIGTATITDDAPVPVVSVTGLGGTVTQGHSFSFTVEATTTLTSPLSVEIAIEDQNSGAIVTGATPSGVFIPDDSGSIMIPTSGSVEVVVTTANPGSISGNVTGNITLYPSSSGTVFQVEGGGTFVSYDVVFKDNTASTASQPRLSIAGPASSVRADQSASADFTITSTPAPTGTIDVYYNVSETGNFVTDGDDNMVLTFTGGTATLPITTSDSVGDDADSTLTVTLLDRSDYSIADNPGHIGTATITDDAPVPVVSVTGLGGTVTQGHSFSFTVEATGTLTNPLSVEIAIEDQNSGAIVTGATPSGVFIPDDSGSIMIPTSGSVEVVVTTANPGSISGNVTGNITLYPSSSGTVFQVEGGGTFVSYDVVFKDNTASTASQPRLSIAGPASSVRADQSASANFTITSTPAPTGTIDVYYNVSETGNFVTDGDDNMVLTFTGGTATLPITTSDSVGDDADSTLTVTLLDRSDYSIADNPGHIGTATITDDAPVPVVSVTGLGGTVTQGHSFSFTVEATGTLTNPLSVEIAIEDQNSGAIVTGATPSGVFIPDDSGSIMIPTSGSVEVVVTTANPGSISGNVTGNITLYPSSSGTVFQVEGGGTFVSYDVVFKDNTASTASQPRLSIAGPASSVRADQSASADFTITSTPAPTGTIDVYYNVSETGNFVTDGDDNMVLTFTGGTATLPITTSDSVGDDADSTLTVTLLDRSDYSIADNPGHIGTATITDDAPTPPANAPVLTIEANPYRYADDAGNSYIIVSDRDLTQELTVNYQVVSGGTPTDLTATFPVSETYTAHSLQITSNIREIRIFVTDASHTEVKLVTGSNYTLGTPSTATKITPHVIASGGIGLQMKFLENTVAEGDSTTLAIRWTPRDRGNLYTFEYKIGSGSYVDGFHSSLVPYLQDPIPEFNSAGRTSTTHARRYHYAEIQTKERDTTIDSPEIFVRMEASTRWTSTNNLHETSITIMDDGDTVPEVSLSEVPSSVTQGHDFKFKVSASGTLSGDLPITLTLNDGDNDIISGMSPGTLATDGTGMLTIPQAGSVDVTVSTNKVTGHDNQDLTITLTGGGSTYTVASSDSGRTGTVQSRDNTVASESRPRVMLESYSEIPVSNDVVSQLTFTILSSHTPSSPAPTVMVSVSAMGAYLNGDAYVRGYQLETSGTEKTFEVDLNNPPVKLEPGSINVELIDGAGYTLADADLHKTEATVLDGDTPNILPIVSIESPAEMTGVTEGGSFPFTVSTPTDVSSNLEVALTLPDGSSNGLTFAVAGSSNNAVTITQNTRQYSGTINVTNSGTPASGIDAASPTPFTFNITPDTTKYYVARRDGSIDVTVKDKDTGDADTPLMTLTGPPSVVEGQPATYMVTASHAPSGTRTVSLWVADDQTGDFLASGQEGAKTVDVTSTAGVPLQVMTQAVSGTSTGTITVSIVDGADYALGGTVTVSTSVTDSTPAPSLGQLSIASLVDQTFLGGDILYTVTLDTPPTGDNTVSIAMEVSDTGTTGDYTLHPATLEIGRSGTATGRVRVGTTGTFGARTPVEVKISDNASYTFNPQMVSVPIVAAPTDVSVYVEAPGNVNEGSEATVTVHVLPPDTTTTDLTIGLSVADFTGRTAEYIDETTLYKVLETGQSSVEFMVPTKAPTTGLLDGLLVATIVDGVGYTPALGGDVDYVEVFDLTSPADILSVNREDASIVEGQDAVFNISRTRSAGSTGAEVSFQYNLTFSNDNFYVGDKIDVPSTIPAGMDERKITIPTIDISGSFPTSSTDIRLSLENTREFPEADYRIGKKSDTIDITENLPVVSIKNYPTNVTIGHPFTFTVEADRALANPLTVTLDFSFIPTGLFASIVDSDDNAITGSVTIPTTGSNKITVTTAALGTPGDQSGQFFDLFSGTGYLVSTVAAERQPTINFLDNSNPTAARPNVALETYTTVPVNVSDSQLTFNIIASHVPSEDVDVNVLVSRIGWKFPFIINRSSCSVR